LKQSGKVSWNRIAANGNLAGVLIFRISGRCRGAYCAGLGVCLSGLGAAVMKWRDEMKTKAVWPTQ